MIGMLGRNDRGVPVDVGAHQRRRVREELRPSTVDEVIDIARNAAFCGRPVYPISTGRNWGMGSRSPVVDGSVVEVRVPQGRTQLAGLLRALDADGIEVDGVELRRPTLDDVFLTLTGRSLRDGEQTGSADTTDGAAA